MLVALVVVPLSACSAPSPAPRPHVDVSAACAEVDSSTAIPTCTALFDGGLHLPALDGDAQLGGFMRGGAGFVLADGTRLDIADDVLGGDGDDAYASTVYLPTVEGDTVTAVTAVLAIAPQTLMEHVFSGKMLVGRISTASADDGSGVPGFEGDPTLPVVIALGAVDARGVLAGTIANADAAVSTGSACVASLAGVAGDPLVEGFTGSIAIARVPSMHSAFDDELVLAWTDSSSGMGAGMFPSVATLLGGDPLGAWDVIQHGTPSSGPSLALTLEDATTLASC